MTSRSDRVRLARAQVVIEARRIVTAHPGVFAQLETALADLHRAHLDLASTLRVVETPKDAA